RPPRATATEIIIKTDTLACGRRESDTQCKRTHARPEHDGRPQFLTPKSNRASNFQVGQRRSGLDFYSPVPLGSTQGAVSLGGGLPRNARFYPTFNSGD